LKENPENPYAYSQLGIEYHVRGDHARAVSHSIDSIRRGLQEPKFLFNLCLGYRSLGQLDKEVQTARGILAGAPDFLPAWMVVLRHLREEGRLAECAEKTDELLGEFPGAPPLLTARGDLRAEKGELAQALEDYVAVIRQQPNDRDVTLSASLTLARLGDGERAVRLAGRALALSTSELLPWELEKLVRLQSFLRGRHPDGR
ncbi:MAG: hypothetical protein O7J95_10110, partial [Planctomycetota bacterium]|nr:hypothetical protein [Planctomycetota bacterium]